MPTINLIDQIEFNRIPEHLMMERDIKETSMKKYIVLSVNDNVDYLYFVPLTCWAWRQFGWEPIVFFNAVGSASNNAIRLTFETANEPTSSNVFKNVHKVKSIEGYRSDTITQISRLYGACAVNIFQNDSYLMIGDIDMIPLSDYWKPDFNKPTVYGHDLTGFGHYPMCYIGMTGQEWCFVMNIKDNDYNVHIKRDLDTLPQAKDPDFYKYWFSDQDLITQRLKEYGTGKIDFINRGQYANGYAKGRVDRGAWSLNHEQFIDAHLMQQTHHSREKIQKLMDLLHTVWPKEDWKWFLHYTNEFKKLAV